MKNQIIKSFFIIAGLLFTSNFLMAQTVTIEIKTSAICSMCKKNIEEQMRFTKGVKSSKLDVKAKVLTVVYDSKKTSPEKIREAISKAGYDADDVKADSAAYQKLHECCKSDDHEVH